MIGDVRAHEIDVNQRRHRIDGRTHHLDAEQVRTFLKGRVRSLRQDDLRCLDAALSAELVAVDDQRGDDALGAAGGHRPAGRVGRMMRRDRIRVHEVERHGDDFALETRRARAHVALEGVDVRIQCERLVEELVVLHIAAVHRSRALAGLPERIFLFRHLAQLVENRLAWPPGLRQPLIDGEAPRVRVDLAQRAVLLIRHGVLRAYGFMSASAC